VVCPSRGLGAHHPDQDVGSWPCRHQRMRQIGTFCRSSPASPQSIPLGATCLQGLWAGRPWGGQAGGQWGSGAGRVGRVPGGGHAFPALLMRTPNAVGGLLSAGSSPLRRQPGPF